MLQKRKWRRWIRVIDRVIIDSIREDKLVFDSYYALLESNAAITTPWNFHQWVLQNHGRSLMLQVRKLADRDKRSYSLRRLMEEMKEQIKKNPGSITRHSFVTAFPKRHRNIALTNWTKYAGGARVLQLRSTVPEKDIKILERITRRICVFVDKDIAHLDRRRRQRPTDFDELYELLRRLVSLAAKYGDLLGVPVADDLDNFTIAYDWMSIFDLPWRLSASNQLLNHRLPKGV